MALDFASGKQVDFGNPTDSLDAITVMSWCYTRAISNNLLMFSRTSSAGGGWSLGIRTGGTGRLRHRLTVNTSAYNINSSSGDISTNTWFHTAFTWSSATQSFRCYLNGLEFGNTGTVTGTLPVGDNIVIGGRDGSNTQNDINGQMDDSRIYQRQLSAEEIAHIYYSRGRDGIYDGLYLQAQSNEKGEGQAVNSGDVKDYSPFQHSSTTKGNGTLTYNGSFNAYTRRVA